MRFLLIEGEILNVKEIRAAYDYSWTGENGAEVAGVKVEFRKGGFRSIPNITAEYLHHELEGTRDRPF